MGVVARVVMRLNTEMRLATRGKVRGSTLNIVRRNPGWIDGLLTYQVVHHTEND